MSRDQQIQMGFQAASQVYQQMPVLPDSSQETQYVRKLGQKLVATIPSQYSWPYEFHVVPQKEINAFALPGGPMFVNIGTITAASNEAELAGVMAHEMSHVYMQHSAKQAGKAQTTSMIAGIADAVLGETVGSRAGGLVGELGTMGIQFGAQGLMLKYSRGDEAQADAVGAMILYKAGYNPQALADFFKTLAAQGSTGPQFLSDHPNPGNREEAIQKEIAGWPPKTYATTSAEFSTTRKHAMSVKAYSAQEIAQGAQGGHWAGLNKQAGAVFKPPVGLGLATPASLTTRTTTEANGRTAAVNLQTILPSAHLVTNDLGPLKIAHPDNWQVIASQNGQGVTIAPPAGVKGDAVGYGVVVNAVKAKDGRAANVDQLSAELIRAMQSGGGLSPVGNTSAITVAGVQGRSLVMQSTSPFPDANGHAQKERDWLVTVPRPDGTLMYFVFIAPQSQFDRFRPTYEGMLKSLQFRQ
jgi:Zn-dependent protease with chaperone function